MPYYSDEIVSRVREANDIVDVVSGYVRLNRRGDRYFGLCPFHNEKTPSFSVTKEKQLFYCYGCHAGGDIFRFIQKYESFSFTEALRFLADRAGITLPEREMTKEERQRADRKSRLLLANKEAGVYFYRRLRSKIGQRAYSYFVNRGLSVETMQRFGLGYSDSHSDELYRYLRGRGFTDEEIRDSGLGRFDEVYGARDRFFNRAMFPIMDVNSKVIAFGGRVMGDGQPKYLNSPETVIFNKSRTLYGLNIARLSRRKELIICEGYMDVIALHQAGFDNAVATLGTAITVQHASVIGRYTKDVYLSYDSDSAGRRAALRAISILRDAGIHCRIISLKPYKDPDELIKAEGREAYEMRMKEAQNAFMFTISLKEEEFDLTDPDGKSRFAYECAKELVTFAEDIERNNYISAVARQYGMEEHALKDLVRHTASKGMPKGHTVSRDEVRLKRGDIRSSRGDLRSQRLLLQILIKHPEYYAPVSTYVFSDDFESGVYKRVAEEIFRCIGEGSKVNEVSVVSLFSEEEEIETATSIFCIEEQGLPEDTKGDEKMLREVVLKITQERIKRHADALDSGDAEGFQHLIDEKKQFEDMNKTLRFVLKRREDG